MTESTGMKNAGWRLDGWHAVSATGNGDRVYVRDLVDFSSHEFTASPLSYQERLDIIASVGSDRVLLAMAEIAREKGRAYDIKSDGQFDLDLLAKLAARSIATATS